MTSHLKGNSKNGGHLRSLKRNEIYFCCANYVDVFFISYYFKRLINIFIRIDDII